MRRPIRFPWRWLQLQLRPLPRATRKNNQQSKLKKKNVKNNNTHLFLQHPRPHRKIIRMQPTLRLLLSPRPPPRPLPFIPLRARHRHALLRAVPVADAAVALAEKFVVRDLVLGDVPLYKMEVPREKRIELDEAGTVDFNRLQACAIATL